MCKKRAVDAREAKVPKVYEAQARAIDALFDVTPGESGSMLSALKGYGGSGHAAREAAGGRLGDDGPGDDGGGLRSDFGHDFATCTAAAVVKAAFVGSPR